MVLIWYMPLMSWGWVITLGKISIPLVKEAGNLLVAPAPVQVAWITCGRTFSFQTWLPDNWEMRGVGQNKETAAVCVSQGLLWICVRNGVLSSARDGKGDNSSGPQNQFLSSSKQYRHFVDVPSPFLLREKYRRAVLTFFWKKKNLWRK